MWKNGPTLCKENEMLLQTQWWKDQKAIQFLAAHMRTCALCRIGRVQLSVIPQEYTLTCGVSRRNFPRFYEATRQEAPLQEMADQPFMKLVFHLASCFFCQEEYDMLCLLKELEERDEMRE